MIRPIHDFENENKVYKFRNESELHWNELGNSVAAIGFFDYFSRLYNFSPVSREEICTALSEYYSSFEKVPFNDPQNCIKNISVNKDVKKEVV